MTKIIQNFTLGSSLSYLQLLLNDFWNEKLKMVEKFSLDSLFRVNRFVEGYYNFENTKVGSL